MKIYSIRLLHNYYIESLLFKKRTLIAFIIICLLSSILIINLYYLQIINLKNYKIECDKNHIKLIPISPNRGVIYDCNGIPLATNRIMYQLEITPNKVNNLNKTINSLKTIINLTNKDIDTFKKKLNKSYKFNSLTLKTNLTEKERAQFAVNQFKFSGVNVKGYQHRYYPCGSTMTHVIGYVSKIDFNDLNKLNKEGNINNYVATNNIGKLGIEKYYENILHGKTGYYVMEVNNKGEIIKQLYEQPPQAGKDIILTLDSKLQKHIEKLLMNNRASVIVLDPRDGSIRSLISNPSYDPNLFVNGISYKDYQNLLTDKNCPLLNRATQGIYPPASTVKPYISVSALTTGIINKNVLIFDPGWWQIPGSTKRYRDWKKVGHGYINITKAIEESADTFFYKIAYDMGIDELSNWMTKFGYGKYTGIDLSEEIAGIMPNKDWKMKRFKKPWYLGDTIPIGIGQGYWVATPIQMSKALMTLINNGFVRTPHLINSISDNSKTIPLSYFNKKNIQIGDPKSTVWKIAKDGMFGAANRPNGTVCKIFVNSTYKAAAKSGTAQVYGLKDDETYNAKLISEKLKDHKLMTAFAPYENPTVAVVVILENGGTDTTVGKITRKIFDYIFSKNIENNDNN